MDERDVHALWDDYYAYALENTKSYLANPTRELTLIEVAAQHPLINGVAPNEEFSARLDFAIKLYNDLIDNGQQTKIYVPGSRHKYEGIKDDVSLSDAGVEYLLEHELPQDDILGIKDLPRNLQNVYCSEDECETAYELFTKFNCKKLLCVCSPGQLMRKNLYYIKLGILPDMCSVPCDDMFHNPIEETFVNIPKVIHGLYADIESVRKERFC